MLQRSNHHGKIFESCILRVHFFLWGWNICARCIYFGRLKISLVNWNSPLTCLVNVIWKCQSPDWSYSAAFPRSFCVQGLDLLGPVNLWMFLLWTQNLLQLGWSFNHIDHIPGTKVVWFELVNITNITLFHICPQLTRAKVAQYFGFFNKVCRQKRICHK